MDSTERLHFQRTDIGPFSIYATAVKADEAGFVAAVVVQRHVHNTATPKIVLYDDALFEAYTFSDPAEAIEVAMSTGRVAVMSERMLDARRQHAH